MPRMSSGIYTPTQLRLMAADFERTAAEIRTVADMLASAEVKEIEITGSQGVEDASRWSKQFASHAHRAFLTLIASKKPGADTKSATRKLRK